MQRVLLAPLLAMLSISSPLWAKSVDVKSPNGNLVVKVSDDNDVLTYQVSFKGEEVIAPSKLGMAFKQHAAFGEGFAIANTVPASRDQTWEQPWGERRLVRDHHNELNVEFEREVKPAHSFNVRFRVFNDGIGFRYEVPKQRTLSKQLDITDEATEFVVPDSAHATAWWIPGRGWNRYEYIYNTTGLQDVDRAHTPFTMKLSSGVHLSIHEAALVDYAGMVIDQRRPGTLKADLTPWSDGTRVKTAPGFKSPWRTIQVSSDAVGLLNSDIILNLNEPNKLGDVSWVDPGKYVGIWWQMHIGVNTWESGEKHGATTAETKRYMDFAAEHGFDGVLVEGWNLGWDGDWYANGDVFSFTGSYPDFDLAAVTAHGDKKGVKLIGHHETSGSVTNYRNQMSAAFDLYEKHGVAQVKTGYVKDGGLIKRVDDRGVARHEWHDGQFMVGEYLHSITEAAKRKISINTHEPVKDTGLRRTYPNWIAREGARGQEFNAWGSPPNPPEHTAILPYTRMLSGPMDFTPGVFNLAPEGLDAENRVPTTLAKQLSLYVVIYSPIQMAADLMENYQARPDAFQFIKDVPTDWEKSKAIAGAVGDYVAFARKERGGKDWYLGALTDENARSLSVDLDFLDPGQNYEAQIYRDGEGADWLTNPYAMVIETKRLKHGDKLDLELAASGGAAIRFKAIK
jgi:alpha-glucosidase